MRTTTAPDLTIWFLNGPNANLYGLDANKTYGSDSFPVLQARAAKEGRRCRRLAALPAVQP